MDTDLFPTNTIQESKDLPLAARMRPRCFNDYIGQKHILGKGKLLRRAIEADRLSSLILYGAPGCGKTSLAYMISYITKADFIELNATNVGSEVLRKKIAQAKQAKRATGKKTIIFIDELHRFNKAQQDILMPDVENASFILIGATVYNPFFSIVSALLSRSLIFELKPLSEEDIRLVIDKVLTDEEKGLGNFKIKLAPQAKTFLSKACDGDARRVLNALEIAFLTTSPDEEGVVKIDLDITQESIQKKAVVYDDNSDAHYDTASAFIKSMRGTDPDAAIYWMAKMLYAGEDPRFIARRICICACEDVGNADPLALVLANSAFNLVESIGMPEARIALAQAAIYVACAPKSNASYMAIEKAQEDIKNNRTQSPPDSVKDAHYKGAQKLGRGTNYKYAHDYKDHYVKQEYMKNLKKYYQPTDLGFEAKIKERLKRRKRAI